VLPDGRVFIAGGQSAELYDPAIDRWTDLPAPTGWPEIGQALCRVLPNGGVLLGHATSGACAIYDADAEVWRPTTMRRRPGLERFLFAYAHSHRSSSLFLRASSPDQMIPYDRDLL
jgi:hypothetical protein